MGLGAANSTTVPGTPHSSYATVSTEICFTSRRPLSTETLFLGIPLYYTRKSRASGVTLLREKSFWSTELFQRARYRFATESGSWQVAFNTMWESRCVRSYSLVQDWTQQMLRSTGARLGKKRMHCTTEMRCFVSLPLFERSFNFALSTYIAKFTAQ